MRVTIKFRGGPAVTTLRTTYEVRFDEDSNIRDVLQDLIERIPQVQKLWRTPEEIERDTLILRNGIDVSLTGGLDAPVQDGELIVVLPLVHGG